MQVYFENSQTRRTRGKVTPEAREVFLDLHSKGLSYAEISRRFRVPVGTVHSVIISKVDPDRLPKFTRQQSPKQNNDTAITKLMLKRENLLQQVAAINQAIEILKDL